MSEYRLIRKTWVHRDSGKHEYYIPQVKTSKFFGRYIWKNLVPMGDAKYFDENSAKQEIERHKTYVSFRATKEIIYL